MNIELEKLREITNLLFDHMRDDLKLNEVELCEDFYWDIDLKKLYDLNNKPGELDVGQLYDDLEFLYKIKSKEEAPSIMFMHLAPILKYLAGKVGQ